MKGNNKNSRRNYKMVKPSINDILEKINNRYYLVGTVAKRAREIVDGSEI